MLRAPAATGSTISSDSIGAVALGSSATSTHISHPHWPGALLTDATTSGLVMVANSENNVNCNKAE